ncbi:MAG TPA: DUF2252 domain-containing protein [Acidimicrobiales bacterium]|jgi:hypothetical protein|nr:DUF2252 domain-containing protein [Acidimicrobiales bacterium]
MATTRSSNETFATVAQRAAAGKAARTACPRASHAEWSSALRTVDPLDLLAEQATTRVPELIPIRYGRMAASPFAYFRGAALPMAADLAAVPRTGVRVQLCGDAHLSNFGGFASPERDLVFDVNDFDETNPGPFEWDVKRLAASLEIAGRGRGFDAGTNRAIVLQAVRTYRETVRGFSLLPKLDIWYAKLDAPAVLAIWGNDAGGATLDSLRKAVAKAGSKDRLKARNKLTQMVDGQLEFRSDPPLLVPIDDVFHEPEHAANLEASLRAALVSYRRTISSDRRALLNTFRYVATARKVVGVGSVGTRCWLALFVGRDNDDPLLLQIKEAEASVLERFTTKSTAANHGQRVVEGQRLMQAASDIFLGWQRSPAPDGVTRDFYVRQLWDWKASADVDTMDPELLGVYAGMCAWTLARAHARSGDAVMLAGYLGANSGFDRALADFAVAYADQNEVDHQTLVDAIKDGRIIAESDI